MFIWDFVADTVLGQIIDWLYGQIVGFLGDFFMQMGSMGAELFEMSWVQSVVLLFYYLAWALYVTGIVVAAFECGIEYQNGRGSIRDTALNVIKGFLAASLFTTVPKPLFSIPTHQFLFNAGSIDAKFYTDTLQLEDSEYNLIRYPQRGVCLYKCGNERYNLMVHAPEHKAKLFGKAGGR